MSKYIKWGLIILVVFIAVKYLYQGHVAGLAAGGTSN